jgi:glycosyltransferase involved in cell wall biosynthesis
MITFAIPTWNRVDKLEVCLSSLINQIQSVSERVLICVYNNASDDRTSDLLKEFRNKYPDVIEYKNGTDHVRGQESFKRAFMMPSTEWFWMFGDDDILAANGLANIIDILRRKDCDFIHASEFSRVGLENKTFYSTTMELCCGFGFTEMTGFISGNICRTRKFRDVLNGPDCELYQNSSFFQSLAILDAFCDSKAAFVNAPVVDLQERVQTVETCERWNKEDVSLHYADISPGLIRLKEKGVIKDELPDDFFRYLSANLFTKILYNFYERANSKREFIEEKYWMMIYSMAEMSSDKSMSGKIDKFKISLNEYVAHIQKTDGLLLKIQEAHDPCTSVIYPETYI